MAGKVVKAVASKFWVLAEGKTYPCFARKKLKFEGDIYVGDEVEISLIKAGGVIEKVFPRRNQLVRPYIANVDACFIVVAPIPGPDFILVDKIAVNCLQSGIEAVIVANKCDIGAVDLSDYQKIMKTRICSAEDGQGITELFSDYGGATVCLAGQSAVGKSAIINAALNADVLETGALSQKIERGKNTTRQVRLIKIGDTFVADTCGFSLLELPEEITPTELAKYYEDFLPFVQDCRFKNSCTHTSEPVCGVHARVGSDISPARYQRYLTIYNELVEREKEKYE